MNLLRILIAFVTVTLTTVTLFAWRRRQSEQGLVLPPADGFPYLPATPEPASDTGHAAPSTLPPVIGGAETPAADPPMLAAPVDDAPPVPTAVTDAPSAGTPEQGTTSAEETTGLARRPATLQPRRIRRMLWAIVALYVLMAVLYALRTPVWQSPDEPAHFNYVRHIGDGRGLPILEMGDWNAAYLERLKSQKFPPELPVDTVRYEFHQPPLYYAVAAPVYRLASGLPTGIQVVFVRLVSIAFSAAALVVAYRVVVRLFPESPLLQLGVPTFIALIPQRAHIAASVNNDSLAELVVGLVLLASIRFVQRAAPKGQASIGSLLGLGALAGIAFLTKTTIYVSIGIVLVALVLANQPLALALRSGRLDAAMEAAGGTVRAALVVVAASLAVGGWWFVRNALVYGFPDIFGLQRHDLVVTGQPLAPPLLEWLPTFVQVTFQSFWLQFGWMAVPANSLIYVVLALTTVTSMLGAVRFFGRIQLEGDYIRRAGVGILLLTLGLVVLQLILYNLRFEQPQGRYLYPAIIAIGFCTVAGLAEIAALRPRGSGSAMVLVLAAMLLGLIAVQYVPRSTALLGFVGLLGGAGVWLVLAVLEILDPQRPRSEPALAVGATLSALLALNVVSIVALLPYLQRT